VLLSQQLPAIREVSGDFVLQQDSAPAHRARDARQSSCCNGRRPHPLIGDAENAGLEIAGPTKYGKPNITLSAATSSTTTE